ncbi:tRNA (adenosine(37)-N6)-dimethylallyltransferase MiaA [Paremcibacter congregatus]|uniref:tRNA dimethylallyltransferase n=1 Tax=Paremcibacter congregatus TaxID=2043170 RepID=A0A2G4YRP0_9PROT|nr:tRNA (adenosine(37)-N6)-dimethylallyltransferase MiaA [Paremcibacter congregatus]PHZ84947.1 tRNA (adenosine(37)-N6)-dimethylallyltransferase MiaA [Paremcibacter congregatus]QDE26078.1 tRNA (adenosine(37)-N6)-dimethylallyltransferase MiaA [Paremcibacter congregatus]
MQKIILLAGPTASGKTATALDWARAEGGEIINADSMQIYRELDVLSARPTAAEMAVCPHHLYGTLRGDDPCSAERWRDLALPVIEDIWARGRVPIVVGGTGLYFKSLVNGLSEVPEIDPVVRAEIRATVSSETAPEAHARLEGLDPEMAQRLAPGDSQRIARALEVILSTGKSLSYWQNIPPVGGLDERDDVQILKNVTVMERARLYDRCDRRFRQMVETGAAIEEVQALLALNYASTLPVMKSLGVPHLAQYLAGDLELEEAIVLAQTATRQFAKRQMTWFRNQCGDWTPVDL